MGILIPLTMFGAIPLGLLCFAMIRDPLKAILTVYVGCWLFLPMGTYHLPGIPSYNKFAVISLTVLLGIILFDPKRIASFRFRRLDLCCIIFCTCGIFTAISNELGGKEGLSQTEGLLLTWGIPYFVGRLYLGDARGLEKLALAIIIGGLIYVPLCLLEVRFSPQLHRIVYGYHQHRFAM